MDAARVWDLIGEELVDGDRLRQRTENRYVSFEAGDAKVIMDASFTAEELEAIVWFMRHAEPGREINWETGETREVP